jgi:hypothetical protein
MKTKNIQQYKKWSWKDNEEKEPFLKTSRKSRDLFIKLSSESKEQEQEHEPVNENEKIVTDQVSQTQSIPEKESNEKVSNNFLKPSNKREDTYNKMASREMMRQVGMNPYLNNSYVDGITIRDTYLMPYGESKPNLYTEE